MKRARAACAALESGYQPGLAGTLPAAFLEPAALSASPPRWLGDSPLGPGTRPYRLVPPLPVLSSLKSDHLLSAVTAHSSESLRTTLISSPRSSGTVTLTSVGSPWRAANRRPAFLSGRERCRRRPRARLQLGAGEREQSLVVVLLRVEEDDVEDVLDRSGRSRRRRPRPVRPTPRAPRRRRCAARPRTWRGRARARARGRRGCARRRRARSTSSRGSRRSRAPRTRSAARRARTGTGPSSARPAAPAARAGRPPRARRVLPLEPLEHGPHPVVSSTHRHRERWLDLDFDDPVLDPDGKHVDRLERRAASAPGRCGCRSSRRAAGRRRRRSRGRSRPRRAARRRGSSGPRSRRTCRRGCRRRARSPRVHDLDLARRQLLDRADVSSGTPASLLRSSSSSSSARPSGSGVPFALCSATFSVAARASRT